MKNQLFFLTIISLAFFSCYNQKKASAPKTETGIRDLYSDTWVATDGLGRTMPTFELAGPVKNDQRRVVGIFYITWHTQDKFNKKSPYEADVTKILQKDPSARLDSKNPLWTEGEYHWGEPEMGYFLSQDEWVIRKDISMLADAGVDVLVMDVTNAVRYWDEWEVLFTTMQKMKAEGNKVPQFIFWAFNGPVITVVQDLYDRVYKQNKYKDLWFYWDGKPLLLYNGNPTVDANGRGVQNPNPHYDSVAAADPTHPQHHNPDITDKFYKNYTREVKDFFTLRTMWWGYYEWAGKRFVGTEDNWSFGYSMADPKVKALNLEQLLSTHKGIREEAAVTTAQHPVTMTSDPMGVGKSWSRKGGQPKLDQYDLPAPTYVPWLKKTVNNPEGYGIYFQERWDEALQANPQFLYINDWNEWTAGKYEFGFAGYKSKWLGRDNPFYFVDQYNSEFNRGIHPMKGGYTDNYYMQMAQNIRKYKGIRPIPESKGLNRGMKIDGSFADWKQITVEYLDTKGDVVHRNAKGYGGLKYVNNSGRNDIITSKVGVDQQNIYFFAETASNLTPHTGNNWMLLLIDADQNSSTGWFGYDFIINKEITDGNTTTIQKYNAVSRQWEKIATTDLSYNGNALELSVPRTILGMNGDKISFDFHWADNPKDLVDPISLCTDGDSAPNRRFNYRFIWSR